MWSGAVDAALAECRWYLAEPGPALPDPETGCECCNPVLARDLLEVVLLWLHRGARIDLGRVVAVLDADFDRRTEPRPWLRLPPAPWGADGRWRRRFLER